MVALTIRIPDELDEALTCLAKAQRRSKSAMVGLLIVQHFAGLTQDMMDAKAALATLLDPNQKSYSPEEADIYLKNICPIK